MAGKVLIGGTAYTIAGGKACVGGTAYTISGGKTLVGGTAYSIAFKKYTLDDLLKRITIVDIAGRNSSGTGQVQIPIPSAGTYYVFAYYLGRISIYKLAANGASSTLTAIKRSSSTYCGILVDNPNLVLQPTTSTTTCFGATVAIVRFRGYTDAEADTLLGDMGSPITCGSRNNKSAGAVSVSDMTRLNDKIATVACGTYIGFSFIVDGEWDSPQLIFGNNTTNPSLLWYSASTLYYSETGTGSTNVYGASIVALG